MRLFGRKRVRAYSITVTYKSGAKHRFTATDFTYTGSRVSWTAAPGGGRYRPLLIGVDEIESVYQQNHGHVWAKN